ncbi:hypothetical protein E2C01_013784 [Portunus trituberculatus]|uniref:Uncharacterized protein n=1 Tax=Portunus trituberculatus TaxID=210409 RepID=A0A5B7DIA1_PORTR|nr:hypothetical protein [Portunus trituberculatus]
MGVVTLPYIQNRGAGEKAYRFSFELTSEADSFHYKHVRHTLAKLRSWARASVSFGCESNRVPCTCHVQIDCSTADRANCYIISALERL